MSFLTPLYIAGLAAIALPIVFHLIRRTPRGHTPFSSLMFLVPTPPRITRRSRLDQWLLLLLRGLALALLALAFARPFLREAAQFSFNAPPGQRIAILVDASASMRRDDLWRQARQQVSAAMRNLSPADRVALFTFDQNVATHIDFSEEAEAEPKRRVSLFERRLSEVVPSWHAGDLGAAIANVADRVEALDHASHAENDVAKRIILVSDFAEGEPLEALQSYEWPAGVELEVKRVAPRISGNAGLQLVGEWIEGEGPNDGGSAAYASTSYRVRVTNTSDSSTDQFQLVWKNSDDQPNGGVTKLYVPPGQSRTVTVARPPNSAATQLILEGDSHPFDNTVFVAPLRRQELTVAYLGSDSSDDPQGCRYYLERLFSPTTSRTVSFFTPQTHEPLEPLDGSPLYLVVVAQSLEDNRRDQIQQYLKRGGRVLFAAIDGPALDSIAPLLGSGAPNVSEATVDDYVLLGQLDFSHPLILPFADPRYSDFSKIHFWRYRQIALEEPLSSLPDTADRRVVARFDSGDPALIEQRVAQGRLFILTTTWRPADSQLARSSKFVPLLWGLVGAAPTDRESLHYVGAVLTLSSSLGDSPKVVQKPDGAEIAVAFKEGRFDDTDQPGLYRFGDQIFGVNVDPAESHTAPRDMGALEQYGVRLTSERQRQDAAQRERHLRDVELESRQKIWRWLLAVALVALVAETWLAGRRSR
jgi:hypothetical protein